MLKVNQFEVIFCILVKRLINGKINFFLYDYRYKVKLLILEDYVYKFYIDISQVNKG